MHWAVFEISLHVWRFYVSHTWWKIFLVHRTFFVDIFSSLFYILPLPQSLFFSIPLRLSRVSFSQLIDTHNLHIHTHTYIFCWNFRSQKFYLLFCAKRLSSCIFLPIRSRQTFCIPVILRISCVECAEREYISRLLRAQPELIIKLDNTRWLNHNSHSSNIYNRNRVDVCVCV